MAQLDLKPENSAVPKRNLLERMVLLEQALEQSLDSWHELRLQLRDQHLLETQLAATEEFANLQKQAINELQQQLAILKQDALAAQIKIGALETQLAELQTAQARWQQVCQEMATERDSYLSRLTQLEQVTILLQEKLLQQAQQASEYEAAVQYWKDLYNERQRHSLALKAVLERLLSEPTAELSNILDAIQPQLVVDTVDSDSTVHKSLPSSPLSKPQQLLVDLPAFLNKRCN